VLTVEAWPSFSVSTKTISRSGGGLFAAFVMDGASEWVFCKAPSIDCRRNQTVQRDRSSATDGRRAGDNREPQATCTGGRVAGRRGQAASIKTGRSSETVATT